MQSPPELTEEALWAVVDEVAGPEVVKHLSDCPYCAARLEALRHFGRVLSSRLYRTGCPSVDTLGDYAMGLLDKAASSEVDEHLITCAHCAGEVQSLKGFLAGEAVRGQPVKPAQAEDMTAVLLRGIRRVVATLLPPEPGLALRGAAEAGHVVASTPHERIILELEPSRRGETREMTGQLIAEDDAAWQGALVEVDQDGTLAAAAVLDEMNEFACAKLKPVMSRVTITSADGQQIVIDGVQLAM